jgi:hypothetical protein
LAGHPRARSKQGPKCLYVVLPEFVYFRSTSTI